MIRTRVWLSQAAGVVVIFLVGIIMARSGVEAQDTTGPQMLDPNLRVRTVVSGLNLPIAVAFLGVNDLLVLEKDTGQVKRVVDGVVTDTVLDLGVNRNSERGLLGIALHPDFPEDRGVYLYWTCRSTAPPADPFVPDERTCLDTNMFAQDSSDVLEVPLLGNRVDRFLWNGSTLQFDRNVIMLRAFQNDGAPTPPDQGDEAQPPRGNHNGGVLRLDLMASCTSSSGTTADAVSCRTLVTGQVGQPGTTTSSVGPNRTTHI